ncbi:MAG: FecCD family ABC transporter permease [Betaproteobacteria bacterium]
MLSRPRWLLPAGVAVVALLCWSIALSIGSVPIPFATLWNVLVGDETGIARTILVDLRVPRAAAAFCAGALLAVSGCLIQVLLRNPLGDPYVLGISGGAAVLALFTMALGMSGWWLEGAAFLGALGSMYLVFTLAAPQGAIHPPRLLLTGVIVGAAWSAVIALILSLAPEAMLRGMVFWLIGDLSGALSAWPAALALAAGLLVAIFYAKDMNILPRGELAAAALGVNVARVHYVIYFLSALMTAASVTSAGTVGFVGLVTPHALRLMGVSDLRILLPTAALAGGTLLLAADTVARTAFAPQQLPVGVITALIGVPVFLFLMRRR